MADEKNQLGADEQVLALKGENIPLSRDNMSVPAIFADALQGFAVLSGTARFGLVEHRANFQTREVQSIPVGHIIMPLAQVKAWAEFFTEVASRLPAIEGQIANAVEQNVASSAPAAETPDGQ